MFKNMELYFECKHTFRRKEHNFEMQIPQPFAMHTLFRLAKPQICAHNTGCLMYRIKFVIIGHILSYEMLLPLQSVRFEIQITAFLVHFVLYIA